MLRISGSGLFGNEGITSRIFDALADEKIKSLMLTQGSSGLSICIAVLPDEGQKAKSAIENALRLEIFDGRVREITAEKNLSIIAVVGEDITTLREYREEFLKHWVKTVSTLSQLLRVHPN